MTLNTKLISLVLLTSMTTGGILAKNHVDRVHAKTRVAVSDKRLCCDSPCDKKSCCKLKKFCCRCCKSNADFCDKKCKTEDLCLSFKVCLSFEQTVFFNRNNQRQEPRDPNDKPGDAFAKFEICFAEDFSQARYRLLVDGLDPSRNPNEQVVGAFLCFGDSRVDVAPDIKPTAFFPVIAPLLGLNSFGDTCNGKVSICDEDILTNESLREFGFGQQRFIPTLRAVYQLCRQGLVFILIVGSDVCPNGTIQYGTESGGMFRAQVVGKRTAAGKLSLLPD